MKKLLLTSGLLMVGCSGVQAAQKTEMVNTGMPVEQAPKMPVNELPRQAAPAPKMATPPAHVMQLGAQMANTFGKVQAKLTSPDDMQQLAKAFEQALDQAFTSKDFEAAFNKMLSSVSDMGSAIGVNIKAHKELYEKLNDVVKMISDDINAFIKTGVLPVKSNEYYLVKMANSLLEGMKKGLAKTKPTKNNPLAPKAEANPAKMPAKTGMPQLNPAPEAVKPATPANMVLPQPTK